MTTRPARSSHANVGAADIGVAVPDRFKNRDSVGGTVSRRQRCCQRNAGCACEVANEKDNRNSTARYGADNSRQRVGNARVVFQLG
jgi:hypothetical protein